MDKRQRPALQRYRNNKGKATVSITVKLTQNVLTELQTRMLNEPDNNMSRFIEDTAKTVIGQKFKLPANRRKGTYPIKKTFLFSADFAKKLKKEKNISIYVEALLDKAFNL